MSLSLTHQRVELAKSAAAVWAAAPIASLEKMASRDDAPLDALLAWARSGIGQQESLELSERIQAQGLNGQARFQPAQLAEAAGLDHRLLALLEASPEDGALSRRLSLLAQEGWAPEAESIAGFASLAAERGDSEALVWLAENARLPAQSAGAAAPVAASRSIVQAFRNESARDLANLTRLANLGVFADGEGFVGLADFMANGQMKCARALSGLGFKPRDAVIELDSCAPGSSPIVAYARLAVRLRPEHHGGWAGLAARIESDLDDLKALGVSFSPNCAPGEEWLRDPFLVSARERARPAVSPALIALYKGMASRGANLNLSGLYLAEELRLLYWQFGEQGYFDLAMALGANPSLRPDLTLSAICSWNCAMTQKAPAWMDKFIGMGADVSVIPISGKPSEHPLAVSILNKGFKIAKAALARGVSPEWVSSEDGASLLHLLAPFPHAPAIALCASIASDPRSKSLIDHKMAVVDGDGGRTALMLASAALNAGQVEALLKAGANPNEQDARGWTALHHAGRKYGIGAQLKCAPVITALLSHGADPSIANASGLTPGQAMAKRAPIKGLAELLRVRPEDLTEPTRAAKKASQALSKRGGEAISVAERAILSSIDPPAVKNTSKANKKTPPRI